MDAWIARDKSGRLFLYRNKPHKDEEKGWHDTSPKDLDFMEIDDGYPEVTWDRSPCKVEVCLSDRSVPRTLNKMAYEIHADAVNRGFYDEEREIGTLLMLIVSELSEALEADMNGHHVQANDLASYSEEELSLKFSELVKDSFEDEIADAIIRLLDLVGYLGIDIDTHIKMKMAYNRSRAYKHGKKC